MSVPTYRKAARHLVDAKKVKTVYLLSTKGSLHSGKESLFCHVFIRQLHPKADFCGHGGVVGLVSEEWHHDHRLPGCNGFCHSQETAVADEREHLFVA